MDYARYQANSRRVGYLVRRRTSQTQGLTAMRVHKRTHSLSFRALLDRPTDSPRSGSTTPENPALELGTIVELIELRLEEDVRLRACRLSVRDLATSALLSQCPARIEAAVALEHVVKRQVTAAEDCAHEPRLVVDTHGGRAKDMALLEIGTCRMTTIRSCTDGTDVL
jgi:hypothetical protein